MCLWEARGVKSVAKHETAMSMEPAVGASALNTDAQKHFLQLALAVAKNNAIYRVRFPEDDPIYQLVENSFFGTFDDMPIQLHILRTPPSLHPNTLRPTARHRPVASHNS